MSGQLKVWTSRHRIAAPREVSPDQFGNRAQRRAWARLIKASKKGRAGS